VVITDQLDVTNDDLGSLSLGPITFGTQLVTPSPLQTSYSTTVDLGPATNLLVAVNGNLNSSTGLLTWNLQSLDPTTMQPPTDPTVGFLPPGTGGSVFFTVSPKKGLATNTQIQNQATVVFDVNPPMNTPAWLNTLDNTPPTSSVQPLPSTEPPAGFTVSWSGTDVGAGVQDFTIYVSDNGSAFTVWRQNTTATSAAYTGQVGHTYGFYSIARDLVGNVEAAKTSAEATTTVALLTPTVSFTGAPASAVYNSTFTVASTTNASTTAVITASGACSIVNNTVTMTGGAGTCSLTASWAADSTYLAATASQSTAAVKAGSTATITANVPNPAAPGQAVVVSFNVAGNGSPTGGVTVAASTGESCSGTLTAGAGSCSLTFLTVGSRALTASYLGDMNFNGSTSAGAKESVIGPLASFSPASVNFGNVYLGLPAVQMVTLTNTGNASLVVTRVTVSGGNDSDDFKAFPLCPPNLAAGKSCQIIVTFVADRDNYSPTGMLSVTDNALGSPQSLPLSATVINPKASLSSYGLNFGKQKVGTTSAAKTVTLTNTGTTALALSTLTISGDFALASGTSCANGGTLAPTASCAINVTFTPAAKGTRLGNVTIKDNAFLKEQIIGLSGTGD
jgi:hypothetical protein